MGGPDFGFIALLIVIAFTIFYTLYTRHLERMARIEHGLDEETDSQTSSRWLGLGIVVICIGLGLLLGYFISSSSGLPIFVAIPSTVFISGGIGMVVIYLIGQVRDI